MKIAEWIPSAGTRWYVDGRPCEVQKRFGTGTVVVAYDDYNFTTYLQGDDEAEYEITACAKSRYELQQERAAEGLQRLIDARKVDPNTKI